MLIIIKAILLFLSVFIILPIVFFILVGTVGKYFSLTVDPDCWLAKTKIKWIRFFIRRFIVH
ncbi:hypothetical protein GF385_01965 [Candidatus Dependentiae bacterium]|nr:hypothetical protein [Candidatus Dependentiae bacterium]